MNSSEVKELILSSLSSETDAGDVASKLEQEGVIYDFGNGFSKSVIDKILPAALKVKLEIEFVRNMNFAFKGIAISGAAAIVVLLISIFIMEGSISINSFLGLKDNYDETIVCLLTGK
jgi:hypothetical protein